ncbi:MAG TPA: bifunctional acetate--CoA ligase family protein/GNAT family N-acetyltransferase [Burkholderiales bacterium]|nr:bifunctional acetate--CoA ligase family protein/GNAT family N-acetyltransferase [Burkholderiales bacterium]
MLKHTLQPLLAPSRVALVGASERPGSLGDIVFRNLAAGLGGKRLARLYPVNPKHRQVHGAPAFASLGRLPEPVELAVVATPARTVPGVLAEAGAAGIRAAVVLTSGFGETGAEGRALQEKAQAAAKRGGVRILGPNCLGLMRTDTGLNATFARTPARPGRLALVSQSGAICGAILDWAASADIGFTSVVSLGAAVDVDFGEVLDFLVADELTEAILLYVEGIRDARRYLSALRAAARVKPVVALKVGRHASGSKAAASHTGALVGSDAVFDAALRRAGTVRVKTYTQLFAAARVLSAFVHGGRFPEGDRLAVVTNGGGPGVIAADSAAENGIRLAALAPQTLAVLDGKLPPQWSRGNPVDIIGDAPAARFRDATAAVLADPGVDAVLAMYSPVAVTAPEDAARAVVEAARGSRKAVLAAWLGVIGPTEGGRVLESQGIPNFYTPENAVEAFSFLSQYQRNQAQLYEVPPVSSSTEAAPADLAAAQAILRGALKESRTLLTETEAKALLAAFGLPVPRTVIARTRDEAVARAREIGFPAVLKIHSPDLTHKSDVGGVRLDLQNEDMVASAYDEMVRNVKSLRPKARIEGVAVQPMLRFGHAREALVGVATDPTFGPVISFGAGGVSVEAVKDTALALPPLNAILARELMQRTRVHRLLAGYRDVPAVDLDALSAILCGVSRMVCALPWLREMDLNPVLAHPGGAIIADARVLVDPARVEPPPRYGHMAIHPYPVELETEVALRDGLKVRIRPIRPDDAEREIRFFDGLSEQSRYQRFMQHLPHLPPRMLARFTQLDYDRELALVTLADDEIVAVGRYAPNADGATAEFALVVADAWQGKGLGRILLQSLKQEAKKAGYRALYGAILEANRDMLDLARRLGFVEASRTGTDVTVVCEL